MLMFGCPGPNDGYQSRVLPQNLQLSEAAAHPRQAACVRRPRRMRTGRTPTPVSVVKAWQSRRVHQPGWAQMT
jgi:hypothetical protein